MTTQWKLCAALAALSLTGAAAEAASITNVALNKTVSLVSGTPSGVALSTVTDGVFRPETTQWQNGSVWWSGTSVMLQIDLGANYTIDSAKVQADDNDTYRLTYHNLSTDTWDLLWDVPKIGPTGLTTRPGYPDQGPWKSLAPVVTDAVRFQATGGDNSYSVAEIQLGSAVPVPASIWGGAVILAAAAGAKRLRTT